MRSLFLKGYFGSIKLAKKFRFERNLNICNMSGKTVRKLKSYGKLMNLKMQMKEGILHCKLVLWCIIADHIRLYFW